MYVVYGWRKYEWQESGAADKHHYICTLRPARVERVSQMAAYVQGTKMVFSLQNFIHTPAGGLRQLHVIYKKCMKWTFNGEVTTIFSKDWYNKLMKIFSLNLALAVCVTKIVGKWTFNGEVTTNFSKDWYKEINENIQFESCFGSLRHQICREMNV